MKNLSIIFDNKPNKWGYRGDPYMWEHLKEYCKNIQVDCGEDRIKEIVKEQFKEITGEELTKKSDCYIEKFAHGGMSSGRVDGNFWVKTGIPLLIKNYKKEKWIMQNECVGNIAFDMSYEEVYQLFNKEDIIKVHNIGNGYEWLTGWYELFHDRIHISICFNHKNICMISIHPHLKENYSNPSYEPTNEEIKECEEWLEAHKNQLPDNARFYYDKKSLNIEIIITPPSPVMYKDGNIEIYGVKYKCTKALKREMSHCANMKEYVEAVEYLAYQVLVEKSKENEGWFNEIN